jgi:hypothetical protein
MGQAQTTLWLRTRCFGRYSLANTMTAPMAKTPPGKVQLD